MRFLADESCDFAVVRALRTHGHDVLAVSEVAPRAEDSEVIRLALAEDRILLTEDRDFGRLVYAHGQNTVGVIFIRFPASLRGLLPEAIVKLIRKQADRLRGAFIVVQPGRVRISRTPGG